MIVVTSSKVGREKVEGIRLQGNLHPIRSGPPASDGFQRRPGLGSSATLSNRPRLSGEAGGKPHQMETQRFRNEAEIERDHGKVYKDYRQPTYAYCRKPEVPPSAPSMWTSRYPRSVTNTSTWRPHNGGYTAAPRTRAPNSSWPSYATHPHSLAPHPSNRSWEWNRNSY